MKKKQKQQQHGGTAVGFILGLVVGLGAALAVAVYVTKVPVPFVTGKGLNAGDRDVEQQKNKSWDPNTPLQGKNPARPITPDAGVVTGTITPSTPGAPGPAGVAPAPPPVAVPAVPTAASTQTRPNPAADPNFDPLGDLARAKSKGAATPAATAPANSDAADPFEYFVQAGAYRTPEDAEAQRAKLAMSGLQAKVTEREQSGRTVFRVRMGPFGKKDEAERARTRLEDIGSESALVRVQR